MSGRVCSELKLVAVGDGGVGKTSLLMSYSTDTFPLNYVPTVFDNFNTDVDVDGKQVSLSLWDTAGQEDYDKLRPLSYANVDVFLVCFSVTSATSLRNVVHKWLPELRHYARRTPVLLVGLKQDLRDSGSDEVSMEEALAVSKEVRAAKYIECSAKTKSNLEQVFNEAIRVVIGPNSSGKKPKIISKLTQKCIII